MNHHEAWPFWCVKIPANSPSYCTFNRKNLNLTTVVLSMLFFEIPLVRRQELNFYPIAWTQQIHRAKRSKVNQPQETERLELTLAGLTQGQIWGLTPTFTMDCCQSQCRGSTSVWNKECLEYQDKVLILKLILINYSQSVTFWVTLTHYFLPFISHYRFMSLLLCQRSVTVNSKWVKNGKLDCCFYLEMLL